MDPVIAQLFETISQRRTADPASSYVARLIQKGPDSILKKIGEEATEVVIAAKDGDNEALVYEVADLCFHTLVLLASLGLSPQLVIDELRRREGVSGIVEKASRS